MWRGKPVSVSAGHNKSDATAFARMVLVLLQGGVSAGAVSVFCRVVSVVSVVLQRQVRVMSVFSRMCQCFGRVVSVVLWGCYSGVNAFTGQWCQFLFLLGSVCVVSAFAGKVLQGGVRVSVFAGQCQYFCMGVSVLLQSSSAGHV